MSTVDLEWIKKTEAILRREIQNSQFGVNELADELALGRRQVQRRIKKITGLSPNHYIRQIKLSAAREMLESGQYETISEVCYQVGFDTPHYFSNLFEQHFGRRPSDYRVA